MNKKSLLAILLPVLICIIIFILPSAWQEKLAYSVSTINWWNWFTYIFVHESMQHLLGNLIIYLIAISFVYWILVDKDRALIPKMILYILIIIPLITLIFTSIVTYFHLIPPITGYSRGFSGVVAGILGLLGVCIAKRIQIKMNYNKNLWAFYYISIFMIVPALALMIWNITWKGTILILIIWILMLISFIFTIGKKHNLQKNHKIDWNNSIKISIGIMILLIGMVQLVPPAIKQPNGSIVNILAHLIGFVSGFCIAFLVLKE